ncbi:Lipoprotein LipO precursor [Paenibacillus konkukensis]|uniref:Lipoprotein LipO n=1 Tax=Paenibacillus konkukensis TaxID=2020716 RepID=A0ABY4RK65_9BACL|nr:extracellular solute-binding protein [Paenibacillus konkukensis]UQZ82415.1 Lipoprotein LipO precursor [Paenibacillus konkukensis]
MIRSKHRKVFAVAGMSALLAFSAACASQPGASGGSSAASDGPVTLNLAYYIGWNTPSIAREDNPSLKYIEDRLGIRLNLTAATPDIYKEKVKVAVASGDIPDAFAWTDMDDFIVKLIKSGVIVPLDKYIDEYPNLKKEKPLFLTKYQGSIYGLSSVRNPIASQDIPLIRQDWLDNLGLKAPQTLDELYEVAKAFTKNDPDKNGKQDTYGLQLGNMAAGISIRGATGITQAFGLKNFWVKQGDKVVPRFETDAFKQYLAWMNKAFSEGLIDPDFAVSDGPTADSKFVRKGQAGIMFNFMTRVYDFETNYQKTNPNAKLVPLEAIKGPNGERGITGRVDRGGIFVSKKAADDPKKMKKIMEWLDYGASEEGGIFWNYGVEGVHYTKTAEGKIEPDTKIFDRDMPRTFTFTLPVQSTDELYIFPQNTKEAQNLVVKGHKMNEPYLVIDESQLLFSPTYAKYSTEAEKFIQDNTVKTIMGQLKVSDWDGVVKQWYGRFEGNKVVQEIAEAMTAK